MKNLILLLFSFTLLISAGTIKADTATGSFTRAETREDGSDFPLSQTGGHNVYINGILNTDVSPVPAAATSFQLTLPPGTYTLVMTTFDINVPPLVSKDSNSFVFTIDPPVEPIPSDPGAPTVITITITTNDSNPAVSVSTGSGGG